MTTDVFTSPLCIFVYVLEGGFFFHPNARTEAGAFSQRGSRAAAFTGCSILLLLSNSLELQLWMMMVALVLLFFLLWVIRTRDPIASRWENVPILYKIAWNDLVLRYLGTNF